jgi:hypothetical protein
MENKTKYSAIGDNIIVVKFREAIKDDLKQTDDGLYSTKKTTSSETSAITYEVLSIGETVKELEVGNIVRLFPQINGGIELESWTEDDTEYKIISAKQTDVIAVIN